MFSFMKFRGPMRDVDPATSTFDYKHERMSLIAFDTSELDLVATKIKAALWI
jgi:hypothetical protein